MGVIKVSKSTNLPNANSVYHAAAIYRLAPPKPDEGPTITIPVAVFDQLMSVVDLASKAERSNLPAAALLVTSDGKYHTATFSHPLVGACAATARSRLQAIAAAECEVENEVARWIT